MRLIHFALGLALAVAAGGIACATPVTYRLNGNLTASLQDQSGRAVSTISDEPFVWTVTADTNGFHTVTTHGGSTPETAAITDTILVGSQTFLPSIPTVLAFQSVPAIPGFSTTPLGIGGFVDPTALEGIAWHSQALYGYDPATGLSPVPVVFDMAGPLPLTNGLFLLAEPPTGGLVFQVDVDEPSGLALLATGIGALLAARRLRRHPAARS